MFNFSIIKLNSNKKMQRKKFILFYQYSFKDMNYRKSLNHELWL